MKSLILDPPEIVYAIGDVHGNYDMTMIAHEAIRERFAKSGCQSGLVLHLGDILDRGPGSLKIIDAILDWQKHQKANEGLRIEALMGNHEQMLVSALDPKLPKNTREDALNCWLNNGGVHVLAEGGVDERDVVLERDKEDEVISKAIGENRAIWLKNALHTHFRNGNHLYVHAGVDWLADLDEFLSKPWDFGHICRHGEDHWSWIRYPFLQREAEDAVHASMTDLVVIHGHSPERRPNMIPVAAPWRINLDGGSFGQHGRVYVGEIVGAVVHSFTAAPDHSRQWTRLPDIRPAYAPEHHPTLAP